jgi:hypothetical protein
MLGFSAIVEFHINQLTFEESSVSMTYGGDKRPINWGMPWRMAVRSYIFFQLDFLQEAVPRFLPASWRIRARSGDRVR